MGKSFSDIWNRIILEGVLRSGCYEHDFPMLVEINDGGKKVIAMNATMLEFRFFLEKFLEHNHWYLTFTKHEDYPTVLCKVQRKLESDIGKKLCEVRKGRHFREYYPCPKAFDVLWVNDSRPNQAVGWMLYPFHHAFVEDTYRYSPNPSVTEDQIKAARKRLLKALEKGECQF